MYGMTPAEKAEIAKDIEFAKYKREQAMHGFL